MIKFQAHIEEIDRTDDQHAYLDRSFQIMTTKGYVEDLSAPTPHHLKRLPAPPYVEHLFSPVCVQRSHSPHRG